MNQEFIKSVNAAFEEQCGCSKAHGVTVTCLKHREQELLVDFILNNTEAGPEDRQTSMTREDYFKFHKLMTEKMCEITRKKNSDYTGAVGDDPFANFNRVDMLGVCSTEQGFLVRMLDKYMRISSFVAKGFLEVKDESVEDTLLDLANYCLLFAGYLKSKKMGEK